MADNQVEALRHHHVRNPNRNSFNRHKSHSREEQKLTLLPLSESFDSLGFIKKARVLHHVDSSQKLGKDNRGHLIGER